MAASSVTAPVWAAVPSPASRFRTPRREVRKRPVKAATIGEDGAMRPADYLRLVLLAGIWGGSFVFMRVAAPAFGTRITRGWPLSSKKTLR